MSALWVAARKGDRALALLVLAAGLADRDRPDATGRSALHIAIAGGHVPTARLLVRRGARPDVRDAQGRAPAARGGQGGLRPAGAGPAARGRGAGRPGRQGRYRGVRGGGGRARRGGAAAARRRSGPGPAGRQGRHCAVPGRGGGTRQGGAAVARRGREPGGGEQVWGRTVGPGGGGWQERRGKDAVGLGGEVDADKDVDVGALGETRSARNPSTDGCSSARKTFHAGNSRYRPRDVNWQPASVGRQLGTTWKIHSKVETSARESSRSSDLPEKQENLQPLTFVTPTAGRRKEKRHGEVCTDRRIWNMTWLANVHTRKTPNLESNDAASLSCRASFAWSLPLAAQ